MIKGLVFGAALTITAACAPLTSLHASSTKVTYCHVPAGNPANAHTITTSINAAKQKGHAVVDVNGEPVIPGGHGGDHLGSCPTDDEEQTDNSGNQTNVEVHAGKTESNISTHGSKKVTYCHVPAGNPANAHTITTSINAAVAPGHLVLNVDGSVRADGGHGGDYLGECASDNDTTPVTPGKGSTTPPAQNQPAPVKTVAAPVAPSADTLPYTSGDHTFAFTLIAAGLATMVIGILIGIKALYRHSA